MKSLPLYDEPPKSPVEVCYPKARNSRCTKCRLHAGGVLNVCMDAGILPGTRKGPPLMVVGDFPSREEDRAGGPFVGRSGHRIIQLIRQYWDGDIVVDYAIKCAPGRTKVDLKYVTKCREYLAATYNEVQPARVLCFGRHAIAAFTGESVDPLSVRRGYYFMGDGTPVHLFVNGFAASMNRFVGQYLDNDVKAAFTRPLPTLREPVDAVCHKVETSADAEEACRALREGRWVAYDTETSGALWDQDFFEVACLVAGAQGSETTYLWDRAALRTPSVLAPLKALLEDPTVPKVGQNLKFDIAAVKSDARLRIEVQGIGGDTMIWRRQIESDVKSDLAHQQFLVGMGGGKQVPEKALSKIQKAITKARNDPNPVIPGLIEPQLAAAVRHRDLDYKVFAYGLLPDDIMWRYCALDVVSTVRLAEKWESVIEKLPHTKNAWHNIYRSATKAVAKMEEWGMPVDAGRVQELSEFFKFKIQDVESRMFAWGEYNPNSPESVAEFLFGKLGLPVIDRSKETNAPSTKAAVLKQLKDQHPAIAPLLEYRELDRLNGQYAEGMLPWIRHGRVHPTFWLMGARSGRMSSSEPNLQNIPSRNKEYAKMIKGCFIAPPGWVFVQGDYSQLEYRVAAFLTQDENFRQVFKDGHDLHRRTAELCAPLLHGITVEAAEAMTAEEIEGWRRDAKTVNFGTFYGMTVRTLARGLKCSVARAQQIVDAIYGQFTAVPKWMAKQKAHGREYAEAWAYWNGERAIRRQMHQVASSDDGIRLRAENGFVNTPVQGTAALFALAAISGIYEWIVREQLKGVQVCNTVHDSVITLCHEDQLELVLENKHRIMTSFSIGDVPLVVDFEQGRTWGTMHKITL